MVLIRPRMVKILTTLLLFSVPVLVACVTNSTALDAPNPSPTLSDKPPQPNPTSVVVTRFFKGPLSVVITRPLDNTVVHTSPVEIIGQADPGTVLTINDNILLVDEKRTFNLIFPLDPGANLIEITASDDQENQDFAYLTILYEPEP